MHKLLFLILIFKTTTIFAQMPSPIERQTYCNYRIDYFGNIFLLDGSKYETISLEKDQIIKNSCWDPVYRKKYFYETYLTYKYNTTHYYVDDQAFSSLRTPINFDFGIKIFRKHKNRMLYSGGIELFYSFPIPDLNHTNNISDFYGLKFYLGTLHPFSFGDLLINLGGSHLILASTLTESSYTYQRKIVPYLSLEFHKRYHEFIGIIGVQKYISSNSSGSELSSTIKLRYEPPTSKIQVTLSPFYKYALQYYNLTQGITQYFGIEVGYRF